MQTIVVGYDGSDGAKRALERTVQLAQAFGSKVIVTSVAPVAVGAARTMGAIDPTDPPERHEGQLAEAEATLAGSGIDAAYQPAVGEPADAIVEVAEQSKADLIVVGTREPNLMARLLGHSVSETVSRHAHCDVLIVH